MSILKDKFEHIVDKAKLPKLIYRPTKESNQIRFKQVGSIDFSEVDTSDPIIRLIVNRGISTTADTNTQKLRINVDHRDVRWTVMDKIGHFAREFLDKHMKQKHPRVTHLYRWIKRFATGSSSDELTNDMVLWYSYIAKLDLNKPENEVHIKNGIALLDKIKEKYEKKNSMMRL